jgi:ubiquinone/menaquinone biosynthesis C-methylase UbiE
MSRSHREYFNQLAPEWNTKMTGEPEFRDYLIQFGVSQGDWILDIGAGTGRMTKQLIDLVGKEGLVVAEDIAEEMLSEGKRLLRSPHPQWLCDDVLALAFRECVFDKILCFSAFPHFMNPRAALKEMHRVLQLGGKLLILHTCASHRLNEFHASLDGIVRYDRLPPVREMVPLLKQTGFTPKHIREEEDLYWVEAIK